jgi:hypothetical protein
MRVEIAEFMPTPRNIASPLRVDLHKQRYLTLQSIINTRIIASTLRVDSHKQREFTLQKYRERQLPFI